MNLDRVSGIRAHLKRAGWLVRVAETSSDAEAIDFAIIATHPARGAIELLREEAKSGALNVTASEFDRKIEEQVPHWDLIRALRIHDFHRSGLGHRWGAILVTEVALAPRGIGTISLGPLPDLTVNLSGELLKSEFLLWAPPYAQVRSGAPPVHIVAALKQYLSGVELLVRDCGIPGATNVE
jgi:hypothetical protein